MFAEIITWIAISLFCLALVVGPIALILGVLRYIGLRSGTALVGNRLRPRTFFLVSALSFGFLSLVALLFFLTISKSQEAARVESLGTPHEEQAKQAPPPPRSDYAEIEVFYATDRAATGLREPGKHYGTKRFQALNWGTCKVSIPRDHKMGELEAPHWYTFEISPDPAEHVVLMQVRPLDVGQFRRLMAKRIAESRRPEVLLFIHGFNVTFEDAARRTGQLAYDLGQEVPIFYSWPSKGEEASYAADEATVEWTIPHLVEFLSRVTQVAGTNRINVIAHSMGNRAIIRALLRYSQAHPKSRFRNLVLTAPDIDADTFQDLAREFSGLTDRATLYASANDKAIAISRRLHDAPRAGDAGENIVVVDGIDTIDATAVSTDFIAHSYYGDSRTLISDMFYLIRNGLPPAERHGLQEKQHGKRKYWMFKP